MTDLEILEYCKRNAIDERDVLLEKLRLNSMALRNIYVEIWKEHSKKNRALRGSMPNA